MTLVHRMAVLSLASLGAVSACTADGTIDKTFDPCTALLATAASATDAERTSVEDAETLWNEAAMVHLADAGASDPGIAVQFLGGIATYYGRYDDEHGIVFINDTFPDDWDRTLTVAHELGHAFGLQHVPVDERISLMNPGKVKVPPTEEDVAALRALWPECGQ